MKTALLASVATILTALALTPFARADFSSPGGIDLRPGLTPVRHQGSRNTCNAFAAIGLMEFLLKRETGRDVDLSEQFAYWAGKHDALDSDYLRGMYDSIDGLAGFLAVRGLSFGVAEEHKWPYERENGYQRKLPACEKPEGAAVLDCFTGTPPAVMSFLPYHTREFFIERGRIADFLVRERTPVAMNVMWYRDMTDAQGNFVRAPNGADRRLCKKDRRTCGGHVILLVGWDPAARRFLFRNSWGADWGNGGYGTITEEHVLKDCESCKNENLLPIYPPEVREFVRKTLMGVSAELIR